jgi:lipoprotein-anchoring transpeptidase ErfK/SrfK
MLFANTACTTAGFLAAAVAVLAEGATRVDVNERKRRSRVIDSTRILAKCCQWTGSRAVAARLDAAKSFARLVAAVMAVMMVLALESVALADPLALAEPAPHQGLIFNRVLRDPPTANKNARDFADMARGQHRELVSYSTGEAPGTIIIDTSHTYLYYIVGGDKAVRYGIGVGREGFTWSGMQVITRKAEWPDWSPPAEMLNRQPYLPRVMAGGLGNPLGARAMYLGDTAYRIHGTNQPDTIGRHVSSGCIRMLNEDVIDLYARVNVGTKVIVLPDGPQRALDRTVADRSSRTDPRQASSLY